MATTRTSKAKATRDPGLVHGFRSGLEDALAQRLAAQGVPYRFEAAKIPYTQPLKLSKYTPDFLIPKAPFTWADADGLDPLAVLRNCLIVESKGRFVSEDRAKHILIRAQHPDLDIRFVFSNANARISKQSQTTYAAWCEGKNPKKFVFPYASKEVPREWIEEALHVSP